MRRLLPLLLPLLAGPAAPAVAADSSTKPPPAYVDLQPIGLPAVVQGRLVNYVFVDLRILLPPGVDAAALQVKEPYLRDTIVRAAAHTPFNRPGDGVHLDEARLKAEVLRDARAQFGPSKVAGVQIHSQTPQRRTGVPGGAQP